MTEEWREVPGSDGFYEVSDSGRVRSWMKHGKSGGRLESPRILSLARQANGYLSVSIKRGKRRKHERVHCLVLEAFVGPRPKGAQAAHLNDDRADNRLSNLEWQSATENYAQRNARGLISGERHYSTRLTWDDVRFIRESGMKGVDLARKFGISPPTVSNIRRYKSWKESHAVPCSGQEEVPGNGGADTDAVREVRV